MKEQYFLVGKDRRGRGVTVLSRDKTEVSRGVGGGGECRKMGHKCVERMTLKYRDVWYAKSWDQQQTVRIGRKFHMWREKFNRAIFWSRY